MGKMKDIIKEQQRLWNDQISRERVVRAWKERQIAKFEGKKLVEILHKPKEEERNV